MPSHETNVSRRLKDVFATDALELAIGRYVEHVILTLGTCRKCPLFQLWSFFHLESVYMPVNRV